MTDSFRPDEYLPLTEATFLILLGLAIEPKHGYAIMKDVQHLSENRVVFSTGTLYGALRRLLEQEWIVRQDALTTDDANRNQKVYALTETGRRILAAESQRLRSLVQVSVERHILGDV